MHQANLSQGAAAAGGGTRLLQPEEDEDPGDEGLAAGQDALIARIERVPPAVRERQLRQDRDDLLQMQLEHFEGPAWTRKSGDLCEYGLRVLPALIIRGDIFKIMLDVGVSQASDLRLPTRFPLQPDEVEDLVVDVAVKALWDFERLLRQNVWDPSRERVACMATFYVGKCALEFRAPWRRFMRERSKWLKHQRLSSVDPDSLLLKDKRSRPDTSALVRVELDRTLAMLTPKQRAVVLLDALEFRDWEIAEQLGITEKQVEYRLKSARDKFTNLRGITDDVA